MKEKKLYQLLQKKRYLLEELIELSNIEPTPLVTRVELFQEKDLLLTLIGKVDDQLNLFYQSFAKLPHAIALELEIISHILIRLKTIHQKPLVKPLFASVDIWN